MTDNYINYNLKKAKVISLDDPNQSGRVQIQVLPEQKDVRDSDCPWAIPYFSSNSSNELSNSMPLENSIVYVMVDDKWKDYYYLGNKFFTNLFELFS